VNLSLNGIESEHEVTPRSVHYDDKLGGRGRID